MTKERNPWFDNIKGILIFLVVFGHLIETFRHWEFNESVLYLYNVIYAFHMPLFIIVSGYFFRPNKPERIIQLGLVFFIWQFLNGIVSYYLQHQEFITFTPDARIMEIFDPYWTMWYLLGIIVWSIITPYLVLMRIPLIIALSLAFWVSYTEGVTGWFSMRKLINFYPYFLIGYLLKEKNILTGLVAKSASWKSPTRLVSAAITVLFLISMYFFTRGGYSTELFFMRNNYAEFGWSFWKGTTLHFLQYFFTTILCIALMLIVTQRKKLWLFNQIGIVSLFIYLTHTTIVRLFRIFVPEQITIEPRLLIPVAFVFAILICWFISRPPVIRLFTPLMQPNISWMVKTQPTKKDKLSYDANK